MATLYDLAMQYLNQGLPSISPIFQPTSSTTATTATPTTTETGITTLPVYQQTGGGGNGFNPYNINVNDPNIRTSRNYVNPFPFNPESNLGTSDYGYIDAPREGILGVMDKAVNFLPGVGIMKTIGGFLKDKLPVNQRAILENELLGGGIMLDDIGRIVAKDYNTPEGIMAGYNAAMITDKTFDKRETNIRNTLKEKYNLSDQEINNVISEIEETGEYKGPLGYNETLGKTTNLFTNLINLNKAKNIFKQKQNAADIITQRKIEERQIKSEQPTIDRARQAAPDVYREAERQGFTGPGGGFSTTGSGRDSGFQSASSSPSGRGRQDY